MRAHACIDGKAARGRGTQRSGGFTLLELLVSMFIAAIIFAMGYGAINQAAKNRVELKEQQTRLLEIQMGMHTLEQDFSQLSQRSVRQPIGNSYDPALMSTSSNSSGTSSGGGLSRTPSGFNSSSTSGSSNLAQAVFVLTRTGWTNPAGLQRPGLQRVAYYFDNNTLRREYFPVLDATQTSVTVKRDLITHLKSVSVRFLDTGGATALGSSASSSQSSSMNQGYLPNGKWSPIWPPVNNAGQNQMRYRPIAVEVTLETEDFGKIIRLIEVPG